MSSESPHVRKLSFADPPLPRPQEFRPYTDAVEKRADGGDIPNTLHGLMKMHCMMLFPPQPNPIVMGVRTRSQMMPYTVPVPPPQRPPPPVRQSAPKPPTGSQRRRARRAAAEATARATCPPHAPGGAVPPAWRG